MSTTAATVAEVRTRVTTERWLGRSVGLVPTMGALHAGHRALIVQAAAETDLAVVSIFVNPTQFGPNEDFERYPRTEEDDLRLCDEAGAKLVFVPSMVEMYPRSSDMTTVFVPRLGDGLCGAHRPGHFQGVATVVLKLLNIAQPDVAYFGEKDFQQLAIVKRMAADLNVPTEIRGVPTVREADGLALSSRNRYLNPRERLAAPVLSKALDDAAKAVAGGERDASQIRQIMRVRVESESLARLQYAAVVDAETLEPLDLVSGDRPARALLAAYVGVTRLIDNIALPGVGVRERG